MSAGNSCDLWQPTLRRFFILLLSVAFWLWWQVTPLPFNYNGRLQRRALFQWRRVTPALCKPMANYLQGFWKYFSGLKRNWLVRTADVLRPHCRVDVEAAGTVITTLTAGYGPGVRRGSRRGRRKRFFSKCRPNRSPLLSLVTTFGLIATVRFPFPPQRSGCLDGAACSLT